LEYYLVPLSKPWCWYVTFSPDHLSKFNLIYLSVPDLGKVLAGIQVPLEESEQFDGFLRDLGYVWVEETDNEVYKRYLKG